MRNRLIGVPLIAEAIESFRQSFANNPAAEISPVAENNMSGYEVRVHYPSVAAFAAEGNPMYLTRPGKCKGIQLKRGWFFDSYNFDLIFAAGQKIPPSQAAAVQSMLSQVTFDLPPFAFGANPPMAVCSSVTAVMDISAMQQTVVLTVRYNHLSERFCPLHSFAHHAL